MTQGRILRCRRTLGLERRIERLSEQLSEAVSEFEAAYPFPASAIFHFIGDSPVPGVSEYDGTEAGGTILRWNWFPNPDAESSEETDSEWDKDAADQLAKSKLESLLRRRNLLLARLKHRR